MDQSTARPILCCKARIGRKGLVVLFIPKGELREFEFKAPELCLMCTYCSIILFFFPFLLLWHEGWLGRVQLGVLIPSALILPTVIMVFGHNGAFFRQYWRRVIKGTVVWFKFDQASKTAKYEIVPWDKEGAPPESFTEDKPVMTIVAPYKGLMATRSGAKVVCLRDDGTVATNLYWGVKACFNDNVRGTDAVHVRVLLTWICPTSAHEDVDNALMLVNATSTSGVIKLMSATELLGSHITLLATYEREHSACDVLLGTVRLVLQKFIDSKRTIKSTVVAKAVLELANVLPENEPLRMEIERKNKLIS